MYLNTLSRGQNWRFKLTMPIEQFSIESHKTKTKVNTAVWFPSGFASNWIKKVAQSF